MLGTSTDGNGVLGVSVNNDAVVGQSTLANGVFGITPAGLPAAGVRGIGTAIGVSGQGALDGVFGQSGAGSGVRGESNSGAGVSGSSVSGAGVSGGSTSGIAVVGRSASNTGVAGSTANGSGVGVFGIAQFRAGFFQGDVQVTGSLIKPGSGFRIDHPLEPEHKYLSHSFVESPDMKNVYDGVVPLDEHGECRVELPEWFEALNFDFRYQLTSIGEPAPNLHVAREISNNRFDIAGGKSGLKNSWQVTGIRKDSWAQAHRVTVDEEKPENERGYYLNPELYDQPRENSILWKGNSELLRQLEERRGYTA